MSVGALGTGNWNGSRYADYTKSRFPDEKSTLQQLSDLASEGIDSEESGDKLKPRAPYAYLRSSTVHFRTQEKTHMNVYFKRANSRNEIEYKGVTFACDRDTNELKLGNCSNPDKCIRVPLAGGGTLVVNRNNIDDLARAIGMFSPEDQANIMRAIQNDRIAQKALSEIEKTEDGEITEGRQGAQTDDAQMTAEDD